MADKKSPAQQHPAEPGSPEVRGRQAASQLLVANPAQTT